MNSIITPTQMRLHEERKQRLAKVNAIAKKISQDGKQAIRDRREIAAILNRSLQLSKDAYWVMQMKRVAGEREILRMEMADQMLIACRTMPQIVREVAVKHKVSIVDMMSRRKVNEILYARYEFFYRARHETRNSFAQIGRFMGGMDHTSVIHGCRKHAQRIKEGLA